MTIETQVKSILALVTAQTDTLAELVKSISSIQPTGTDNSAVLAKLDTLQASVSDVQAQLEDSPAPAPTPGAPATDTPAA